MLSLLIIAQLLLLGCYGVEMLSDENCICSNNVSEQNRVKLAVLLTYLGESLNYLDNYIIFIGREKNEVQSVNFFNCIEKHIKKTVKSISNTYLLPKEYIREIREKRFKKEIILSSDENMELDMLRDKDTHQLGISVLLDVRMTSNTEAIVKYIFRVIPMIAHGFTVTVKKENDCWIVDKKTEREHWIS